MEQPLSKVFNFHQRWPPPATPNSVKSTQIGNFGPAQLPKRLMSRQRLNCKVFHPSFHQSRVTHVWHVIFLECPKWLSVRWSKGNGHQQEVVDEFVERLVTQHGINLCLTVFNGKSWIRISGHVYNNKDDYLKAVDILLKFKEA